MFKSPQTGKAYKHKESKNPKIDRAFSKYIYIYIYKATELSLGSVAIVLTGL